MDIRDFEGLTGYKAILPLLYIISWVSMFMGPSLFPVIYQKFTIFCLLYILVKIIMLCLTMIYITFSSYSLVSRAKPDAQRPEYNDIPEITDELYYGFIIPNYKQEIELLAETLEKLAEHKKASTNYLVFLAMESHEAGCQEKALELLKKYKKCFRVMDYTLHEIREFEQKGKASNVSWCAEHLEPIFQREMIQPDSVFLTIIDADSWVPELYMQVMEEKIAKQYEKRYTFVYQPIQIFTRNNFDVPVFTRVYDILHSFAHTSNLFSAINVSYPLSNYTLSYKLIKSVGFWDTCADAIGEDFHTTLKCYWKTGGNIETRPIYVCFNQVNISTGNGYWEDVKARFWQAERHAKGVADFAWCFKMILNTPFRWKHLIVFYTVFETFAITAFLPWVVISMNYQNFILYHYQMPSPELYSQDAVSYIFTFMSIFGTLAYFFFEFNKRRSNRILYHQENESILRMLEYPILFTVIFFTMGVPSFVIAAFATLFGHQDYIVADKKIASKRQMAE